MAGLFESFRSFWKEATSPPKTNYRVPKPRDIVDGYQPTYDMAQDYEMPEPGTIVVEPSTPAFDIQAVLERLLDLAPDTTYYTYSPQATAEFASDVAQGAMIDNEIADIQARYADLLREKAVVPVGRVEFVQQDPAPSVDENDMSAFYNAQRAQAYQDALLGSALQQEMLHNLIPQNYAAAVQLNAEQGARMQEIYAGLVYGNAFSGLDGPGSEFVASIAQSLGLSLTPEPPSDSSDKKA